MAPGSSGGAGTVFGGNQLQSSLDKLTKAVQDNTTAINSLRSSLSSSTAAGGSRGSFGSSPSTFPMAMAAPGTARAGGGGAPPTFGQQMAGMNNPLGQAVGNFRSGGLATIGGSLGALYTGARSFGKGQFGTQVMMNSYAQQTSLGMPNNMTFGQQNAAAYGQAFGGNGQTPWSIANGAQDAAQGMLALQYVSGSAMPQNSAMGRSAMGATSAFGYINPALGMTGSAQMAGTMYSPQMSMNMRRMGYSVTPRTLGSGKPNGMGAVTESMMRRWFGSNTVSQKRLMSQMSEGGIAQVNMQQGLGLNASQQATMSSTMLAYNKLRTQGVTNTRADQLFSEAAKNKDGAQQLLQSRYGIQMSDLQSMKDLTSQKTARGSDYSSSYNSALQTSTGLLTTWNKLLSQTIDKLHLNTPLGYAGGVSGAVHNLTDGGAAGLMLGGAVGLGKGIYNMANGAGGSAINAMSHLGGHSGAAMGGTGPVTVVGQPGNPTPVAVRIVSGPGSGATPAGRHRATPPGKGGPSVLSRAARGAEYGEMGAAAGALIPGADATGIPEIAGGVGGFLYGFLGDNQVSGRKGGASQPQAQQSSGKTGSTGKNNGGQGSGAGVAAVHWAEQELGKPYVWGGTSPSTGFDCSGLIQWAYGQAGVKLPRTSEEQWAFLRRKAVKNNSVREGDLVFAAGVGDGGSPNDPGHVGMMIDNHRLIQAPGTGQDVQIINYDPRAWSHAARPSGSLSGGSGGGAAGSSSGQLAVNGQSTIGGAGNSGLGINESAAYGFGGGDASLGGGSPAGSTAGQTNGSGSLITSGAPGGGGGGGGKGGATSKNLTGNKKIMNEAAARYGWGTGKEWQALYTLEMHEAGFNNLAQNATSTAFGMGQFLDSTWATVGGHKTSDASLQAKYMMEYIKNRYHDPEHAWAQYYDHPGGVGYYRHGTANAAKGPAIVGENGPEAMWMKGGEHIATAGETASMMKGGMPALNISFEKGSIVVNTSGSASDVSKAGRQVADELLSNLSAEKIYESIGLGQKN